MAYSHQSVLLNNAIEQLHIMPNGRYIDATFGHGGHACAILKMLNQNGQLMVIDKDQEAIQIAHNMTETDKRIIVFHGSFSQIEKFCYEKHWIGQVQGIFADLGVSSSQLDNPNRGFSFTRDGPLDMRMDNKTGLSAAHWLNQVKEKELAQVLKEYGEEKFAKKIAKKIIKRRAKTPFSRTLELANLVNDGISKGKYLKHPATRTFQAIRILVNNELDDIKIFLKSCLNLLAPHGRLVVISFHSLEDRIVKQFFNHISQADNLPASIPIRHHFFSANYKIVGKAIKASKEEKIKNVRSRSAVMRVIEKIAIDDHKHI